jgi:hypothetical protein
MLNAPGRLDLGSEQVPVPAFTQSTVLQVLFVDKMPLLILAIFIETPFCAAWLGLL